MRTAVVAGLSDADTALLGLLSEEPMHPWQIEKEVRERDMRSWTDLSQSTIYKQLRALETAGFVATREEVVDGRLRRVHALTDPGREALRARLQELLATPQHTKWRVDLATYNVDLLTVGEAAASLAQYRTGLEDNIRGYGELEAFLVASGCPEHRLAIPRRAIRLLEGELRWLDEFATSLAKGATGRE
jgi:DNA-binding PadR family transcriptional regulator